MADRDRATVRYLLDTNIFIYIAKSQPVALRANFDQHSLHDLAMSTITLGELRFGVEKSSHASVLWPPSNSSRNWYRPAPCLWRQVSIAARFVLLCKSRGFPSATMIGG